MSDIISTESSAKRQCLFKDFASLLKARFTYQIIVTKKKMHLRLMLKMNFQVTEYETIFRDLPTFGHYVEKNNVECMPRHNFVKQVLKRRKQTFSSMQYCVN